VSGSDVFTLKGEYHDSGRPVEAALARDADDVVRIPSDRVKDLFPEKLEDLQRFDAVLLGDVGSDTFLLHPGMYVSGDPQIDRLHLIASYVAGGGGLVMIGGYLSFSGYRGMAGYSRSPLAAVLPVRMREGDDRRERPDGVLPASSETLHPILSGIDRDWPPLLGYNAVEAKEGTDILATVDASPLIVAGVHGQGRSVAFTSDFAPHWASADFRAWKHYPTLILNIARWAASAGAAMTP
jgi:uncharacterized membrane protein